MLVERPFQKENAFAQQGSYWQNQHRFGLQQVIVKQNLISKMEYQGSQGVSEEKVQVRLPALGLECNTHLNILRSESFGTEGSSVSGSMTNYACGEPKMVVRSSSPEMNQEVLAFGPELAEYARRFYQSKPAKLRLEEVLIAPCRSNYGPMHISYQREQVRAFFSEHVSNMKEPPTLYPFNWSDQVQLIVECEPCETVLKVANISPRPDKKLGNKPKTFVGFLENMHNGKVDHVVAKKSTNFLHNELEISLSDAPIFQILCEMTEM
jgi:hypothetical protein